MGSGGIIGTGPGVPCSGGGAVIGLTDPGCTDAVFRTLPDR